MSLFSALNTANTALSAQQRAMEVAGQNVANVNTDGYSRQRVDMQSIGGTAVPAIWSVDNNVGGGVDSDKLTRIRDAFLEAQARVKHSDVAALTVQDAAFSDIQQALREPGDTGLQKMMTNMWAGWSDIANHTQDLGARSQLLQRSQTLVAGLHSTMGTLDQQWANSHDNVQTLLTDVNATAKQVALLNQSILSATQANLPTNELQDKRDSLVLNLAKQIGATATRTDSGSYNVVVGGVTLVSGSNTITLAMTGATTAATATSSSPTIVTSPGNAAVQVGGTAAGQLATMRTIIPGYEQQLNAIAGQLAGQVNGQHLKGFDLNGQPGTALFDDGAGDPTKIDARNISVAINDPKKVAAASLDPSTMGGAVSADNGNADALYQLRLGSLQPDGSYAGADTSYRQMIVALGVQASSTSNNLATANVVSTQVDASRESVSGVNIDEEMTNMLQFQHAYAAAGKVVATIQSMMDELMNTVGR
jgi:flagellar hook-associated protein 1 FlgK